MKPTTSPKPSRIGLKITLGCGILTMLTALCCISSAAVSMAALRPHVQDLARELDEIEQGARQRNAPSLEVCVDESIERVDHCGEMDPACWKRQEAYLRGCLQSVALPDSESFCRDVPSEPMSFSEDTHWSGDYCTSRGWRPGHNCITILDPVVEYCVAR